MVWCSSGGAFAFLSTLSLRRATGASHASSQSRRHFYPRSPCGERPWCISRSTPVQADFYPRSPCGERPANRKCLDFGWCISIHALLAESDSALAPKQNPTEHFYPRSPCGERHRRADNVKRDKDFYPRSPCGERRQSRNSQNINRGFLSTLSLRRATGLDGRFKL